VLRRPFESAQFTSEDFTKVLLDAEITISMDGKGRWMDNVFIERLWRSLKYEEVYLHAYETVAEAKAGIGSWISFYNVSRSHQALGYRTPTEVFAGGAGAVGRVGATVTCRTPGRQRRSPASGSHRTQRADFRHCALRSLVHSTASAWSSQ
jgi:hypothetical protein